MDELDCNGNESNLFQCDYLTKHNCGSTEGAGVRCSGTRTKMVARDNLDEGKNGKARMRRDIQIMSVRLLVQQVIGARLVLPDGKEIKIGKGLVVFVCFLKGVTEELVKKAAKVALGLKLSEAEEGEKRVDVVTNKGEVLVVPQATLGGKLKGSSLQYHNNVKPAEGEEMYKLFCKMLMEAREDEELSMVKVGMFGARQVLSMETNGPYSHIIDI